MGTVKTLHIVGYKNSGKTTLISYWVRVLKQQGLKVAVIKHHGHGAKLAMPDEKKDSMQYLVHGADTSIVSGGGYTQHITNNEKSYESLIDLALFENPDVILVEGYKGKSCAKAVRGGKEDEGETVSQLANIQLDSGLDQKCAFPHIASREHQAELADWLLDWVDNHEY